MFVALVSVEMTLKVFVKYLSKLNDTLNMYLFFCLSLGSLVEHLPNK